MEYSDYLKPMKNKLSIFDTELNSLQDLVDKLEKLDQSKIQQIKNKIHSWIQKEIKDKKLARQIKNLKYKKNIVKTIKERIDYLKDLELGVEKDKIQINLNLYVNSVQLILDKEKCIRCGVSHTVCPKEAVTMQGKEIDVENDKCVLCGLCVPFCPVNALEIYVDNEKQDIMYQNQGIPELPDMEKINNQKIKRLFEGTITINESKCPIDCEECVIACPINIIERQNKKVVVDKEKCVLCGACKYACPEDAVTIKRNRILTKKKQGFSAAWTEVNAKFLGEEKINVLENAKSLDKMGSLIENSELKEFTK
jgi:ferredoxin